MFTKALILALAAASTTVAQTHTDCDPREKRCPAAPALAKSVDIDFTKSKGDEYLHTLDGTKVEYDGEKGAIFSIANEKQAPTKASDDYIFFGELHCEVQASPGKGIVTSIVLQSDDLDEIDWEWVGADNEQVQTNYFGKGDDGTYDRGGFHDVANPTGQFHNYGIIWTHEKIDWTIDGQVIRTLTYEEAKGGSKYPQSPMQIKIGTWTAGRSDASPGTVEWAGGLADFKNGGPYIGYYKNCKIVDYMGGKSAATEYAYPDGYDGRWENVIIKNDSSKSDEDETTSKTTKTASATKSAASAESSSEAASTTTVESSSAETTAASSSAEESDAVSESEAATSGSAATPTDDSDAPSGTSDESTEESDEPAAGMMVKANMALGAAGLIAAFFM